MAFLRFKISVSFKNGLSFSRGCKAESSLSADLGFILSSFSNKMQTLLVDSRRSCGDDVTMSDSVRKHEYWHLKILKRFLYLLIAVVGD